MPNPGDRVLFHFVDSDGEPHRTRDAYVVSVQPDGGLVIAVRFLPEDFIRSGHDVLQGHDIPVPHATQDPPESGSWTEPPAS
ncbi:MAG TPA: hypothetical protein VGM94_01095 [Galbitalea sp.]|jgi:hypothetical protein